MIPFLTRWVKKKKPPIVSALHRASALFRELKPYHLNKVFSSDMSIIQIDVCKPSIDVYINYLKLIIKAFKNDVQLTNIQTTNKLETIYIRDFFVDKKTNSLDPEVCFTEFRDLCAEFLDLYQTHQDLIDPNINIQINLRLCAPVINNLVSLSQRLSTL